MTREQYQEQFNNYELQIQNLTNESIKKAKELNQELSKEILDHNLINELFNITKKIQTQKLNLIRERTNLSNNYYNSLIDETNEF